MGAKVMTGRDDQGRVRGHCVFCPACKCGHFFTAPEFRHGLGPGWSFNGDHERPTFSPSMLVRCNTPDMPGHNPEVAASVCHSFVTDGRIQFLNDCTHDLRGKTVDLPDFPRGYCVGDETAP